MDSTLLDFLSIFLYVIGCIIGIVVLALLLTALLNGKVNPRFPCAKCRYFHDLKCSKCVDEVKGETMSCYDVRGSFKCFFGARKRKEEVKG